MPRYSDDQERFPDSRKLPPGGWIPKDATGKVWNLPTILIDTDTGEVISHLRWGYPCEDGQSDTVVTWGGLVPEVRVILPAPLELVPYDPSVHKEDDEVCVVVCVDCRFSGRYKVPKKVKTGVLENGETWRATGIYAAQEFPTAHEVTSSILPGTDDHRRS